MVRFCSLLSHLGISPDRDVGYVKHSSNTDNTRRYNTKSISVMLGFKKRGNKLCHTALRPFH